MAYRSQVTNQNGRSNRRCGPPENYRLLMKYSCPGAHLL